MSADQRNAEIAAKQLGLVTSAQARSAGLSPRAVRHRVEQGRWLRVRRGVYAVGVVPPTRDQVVLAAVLAAGAGAHASHATAAGLWGVLPESSAEIELVIPLERAVDLEGVVAHRTGIWHALDFTVVRGVPVTSVVRTTVDLSSRLDVPALEQLVDEAMRRRVTSLNALTLCAQRFGIAHGRSPKRLHRVLMDRIPAMHASESVLEAHAVRVLVRAGFPPPVLQFEIRVGGRRFRADLAYPDHRVLIEIDGFDFHRSRRSFDSDRDRQNLLVLAGWTVLRFTSRSTDGEIVRSVGRALFGEKYAV